MKKLFNFISVIFFTCLFSTFSLFGEVYFVPPENWNSVDPSKLSEYVVAGFLGSSQISKFNPSINLAIEKTDANLSQYIQAIKNEYKKNRSITLKILNPIENNISNKNGLILISKKNAQFGELAILQAITIDDGYAYVLTAATLKKEFIKYKNMLLSSFKSLTKTDNLTN